MSKLVILDRDGVINLIGPNKEDRITKPSEWEAIPNSLEAIVQLKQAGFTVCVATNQSMIAKGIVSINMLDAIHSKMQLLLKSMGAVIDDIFVCPHQDLDNCSCRKPKPGLLLEASKKYNINNTKKPLIPFVGDSDIDLLAAIEGGFLPVLVKTGKGLQTLEKIKALNIKNLLVFEDLIAFVASWI
jgi:D-glycero-D-manno-heptose 1,7-bisphosphate phosphatase